MRLKVLTLVLILAAMGTTVGLAFSLLRADAKPHADDAESARADESGQRRPPPRLRNRNIPRFDTREPLAEAPPPAPLPVPALVAAPAVPAPPAPPNKQAELRERASRDGYLFREAGSLAVYVVQGGTKFHIKTAEELKALGYSWDRVEEVPAGSLGFLLDRPPEKTLLRERDDKAVFYYENGQKRHITSHELFERMGHKWSDVKVVPSGGLASEAIGAPIQ